MKEIFVEKEFNADAEDKLAIINKILADYAAEGYDLSLRQLYYQLVTKNVVENTERSYKNIGNLVSDARLAGRIDWDMIKDRGRVMVQNGHWSSPKAIVESCAQWFSIDRWANQPAYVEVMVEKQALEGVLLPVCQKYDVPFTSNKGYSSSSTMYEASKRYLKNAHLNKRLYILYLGDHDPSGIDMTRDVDSRLDLFLKTALDRCDEIGENENSIIEVKRLALNMAQVRELNPPENPAKLTDSRAEAYIQRFGRSSWELDAIEPKQLAALVTKAITSIIDPKKWKESEKVQQDGRDLLQKVANKL